VAGVSPSRGIVRVKSVSEPVVNRDVRATGATAVPIFETRSQTDTGAHSTCTIIGPSVRSQSKADWLVTSPTAIPWGSKLFETAFVSANGLPGGSPSRDADVQLNREAGATKKRRKIRSEPIMAMDLPEWDRHVKVSPIDNQPIYPAYYEL
jgi:hypothetical protein